MWDGVRNVVVFMWFLFFFRISSIVEGGKIWFNRIKIDFLRVRIV